MLNNPKILALRDSLAHAVATVGTSAHTLSDEQLRDEVCAVIDELKTAGWPPERAVVAIKEIASEAGLTQTQNVLSLRRDLEPHDALLAKVVLWTIECYYDVPTKVA